MNTLLMAQSAYRIDITCHNYLDIAATLNVMSTLFGGFPCFRIGIHPIAKCVPSVPGSKLDKISLDDHHHRIA